jgi:hypothetical protein
VGEDLPSGDAGLLMSQSRVVLPTLPMARMWPLGLNATE